MTMLEDNIAPYLNSLKDATDAKNFYAALAVAFTIPDICSKLESPKEYTGSRYKKWFNKYLSKYYKTSLLNQNQLLTSDDFYALRCAYLHQGMSDISNQTARKVLNDFMFVDVEYPIVIHNNYIIDNGHKILQIQIDLFCRMIHEAAIEWIKDHETDTRITNESKKLIKLLTW